jgi:histone H3/H4
LVRGRVFSLYDIEEFLKEAGAEKISERAVLSLEEELEDTVKELVDEAEIYANYAGRPARITDSDVKLVDGIGGSTRRTVVSRLKEKRAMRKRINTVKLEGVVFSKSSVV